MPGLVVLKQYLLLIRLPNIFTAPSNILTGYFTVALSSYANFTNLATLMLTSALLYISGIVLNDCFDIEVDRKERPFRPLPAGNISRKNALIIAVTSMIIANLLAFSVSASTFSIAIILSATIIGYNYRLKRTIVGPITMGSARFLNVLLGASSSLLYVLFLNNSFFVARLLLAAGSVFLFVLAISVLSRMEISGTSSMRSIISPFLIVFAIISMIVLGSVFRIFQSDLIVNLVLFVGIIIITFKRTVFRDRTSLGIQRAIKSMILSIIVLDSIFVSGTAGMYYGLATLLLIIPSIILARKLYVT